MRSTYMQNSLELTLETNAESWGQGENLQGTLTLKNHGQQSAELENLQVLLSVGQFKKIKTKDEKAYTTVEELGFDSINIAPGESVERQWRFKLSDNCPITEKKESLFLLFGPAGSPWDMGQLQLYINPHSTVLEYIKILETFYRFKLKSYKNKKQWLEAVMVPPVASKDFSSLDAFSCLFRYSPEQLDITYDYKIRILAAGEAGAKVDKKQKKIEQQLPSKSYQYPGGAINQDAVQRQIESVLDQIKTPKIF